MCVLLDACRRMVLCCAAQCLVTSVVLHGKILTRHGAAGAGERGAGVAGSAPGVPSEFEVRSRVHAREWAQGVWCLSPKPQTLNPPKPYPLTPKP